VRDFVDELQSNPEIKDRFDVESYTFGNDFKTADSLNFDEGQTDISRVFFNLRKLYARQIAPTVLITDGNQTYGEDYEFRGIRYKHPVYPVVAGDTASYVDLGIDRLNVNRYAFLANKFPVEVFFNYKGGAPVSKNFTITQNGKPLYQKTLKFDGENRAAIVKAALPAGSVGVKTYKAEIAPLDNEKNTANNSRKFAVEIIDQKTKVLLLSAFPHPDLGAFKKAIEHNKQRQADIKYIDDAVDFGDYQLVVLYQPEANFKEAYEKIDQLGLNTLTVTGPDTDNRF